MIAQCRRPQTLAKGTKLHLCILTVIPTDIEAGETWNMAENTNRMPNTFNSRCPHLVTVVFRARHKCTYLLTYLLTELHVSSKAVKPMTDNLTQP